MKRVIGYLILMAPIIALLLLVLINAPMALLFASGMVLVIFVWLWIITGLIIGDWSPWK